MALVAGPLKTFFAASLRKGIHLQVILIFKIIIGGLSCSAYDKIYNYIRKQNKSEKYECVLWPQVAI